MPTEDYGPRPSAFHGPQRQQRLINTAHHYLQRQRIDDQQYCRFDVVDLQNHQGRFKVEWIKNAFELSE